MPTDKAGNLYWIKYMSNGYDRSPEARARVKRYNQKVRLGVLIHYSNGRLICNCCGEKEYKFLCIDHINNDGYKNRVKGKRYAGTGLYSWIKSRKYPDGFQVLCHNCNCAKAFYGDCPHKSIEFNKDGDKVKI